MNFIDGIFQKKCENYIKKKIKSSSVKLTNSCTSALEIAMILINLKKGDEVIIPSYTFTSTANCIIMRGAKPVFVDINFSNLSMNVEEILKKISKKTLAVFITHAQGFNGLNNKLLQVLKKKKIHLIEDVSESHGATFKGKRLGNYGLISNFSFYYAHHLTTIEGGMVCTNSKEIYEIVKILRSHGMLREANNKKFERKYKEDMPASEIVRWKNNGDLIK